MTDLDGTEFVEEVGPSDLFGFGTGSTVGTRGGGFGGTIVSGMEMCGDVRTGEEVEIAYGANTVETIAEGCECGGLREEHE